MDIHSYGPNLLSDRKIDWFSHLPMRRGKREPWKVQNALPLFHNNLFRSLSFLSGHQQRRIMEKQTLDSSSTASAVAPEDAWVHTYQRLQPQWQSFSLSQQVVFFFSFFFCLIFRKVFGVRLGAEQSQEGKTMPIRLIILGLYKFSFLFHHFSAA